MKFLIDMNLSPDWVPFLEQAGWEAVHWSTIGSQTAPDHEIMAWARANCHIVITHDLDFGRILFLTKSREPSVVQLRTEDTLSVIRPIMVEVLRRFEQELKTGAIISIDTDNARARILPLD